MRILVTPTCVAMMWWLTVGAMAAHAQEAPDDLNPPDASFNAARAKVRQIEKQIAVRIARAANETDAYKRSAIDADVNLRLIARRLLTIGIDHEREGAAAIVAGYTLANRIEAAGATFEKLPRLVAEVKGAELPADADLARAAGFAEAVNKFNERAEKEVETLVRAEPRDVDRYLARMLEPLDAVLESAGEPKAIGTWIARPPIVANQPVGRVTEPMIERLSQRVALVRLPHKVKTQLMSNLEMIRQAGQRDDLRESVFRFYGLMDTALSIGEGLRVVEWLDPAIATSFREQLQTAVVLMTDPRTRDGAYERFVSMGGTLRLAARLHRLHQLAVPVDAIRDLLGKWYAMHIADQDPATSLEVYDYLDRLTDAMLRYRELLGAEVRVDLRRTALSLRTEYQQQELALLAALPRLSERPAAAAEAVWTDPLDSLVGRVNRLNRVYKLPQWIAQLDSYKPRPAGGIARQLRQIVLELNNPQRGANADTRLRAIERDAVRFAVLTYEQPMREGDETVGRITGGLDIAIVQQIDRVRQAWATAYASGQDPTQYAERLDLLDRLGRMIRIAHAVRGVEPSAERLNAWAGWEVPANMMKPLADALSQRVIDASRHASIAQWAALSDALDQLEAEAPLPLLVAQLGGRINARLPKPGSALGDVTSQLAHGPRRGALAEDQRDDLALICLELTEAAHARSIGKTEQLDASLAYAGRLARRVLEHLDAADRAELGN